MTGEGEGKPKVPGIRLPKITVPSFNLPAPAQFEMPRIDPIPFRSHIEDNYASAFHKRLLDWIQRFDDNLDQEHEVGVRLVSFGQSVTFHLENMGYRNPSLISFSGKTDSGQPVELVQHVSQISILLVKLPRKDPSEPKRPIGFQISEDGGQ